MQKASKQAIPRLALLGVLVVAGLLLGLFFFSNGSLTGFLGLGSQKPDATQKNPTQYLSREVYFKEAFTPDRANYDLFEAAAQHTGIPVKDLPAYFNLRNEEEIFAALPPVPEDFSEIAFWLARGDFFDLSSLSDAYYLQPEFYPNFTNQKGGLRWWREPDPTSWGTNGFGSYPAEQWTTLKKGETENFEATFFLYASWGVQTFQGLTLFANGPGAEFFDIQISPKTFILEPTFPKFYAGWVKKITVRGSLKPNVPSGEYNIGINVGLPPNDKQKEWEYKYRNLYQNAATGIRPAGNQIDLHVKVE